MGAKIRKLTLSYPFTVEGRHQRTVFSVDDDSIKFGKHKVAAIEEGFCKYRQQIKYSISISDGEHFKLWKDVFAPNTVAVEIEYDIGK